MHYKIETYRPAESYDSLRNTLNHLRIEIGKCKEVVSISVSDNVINIESNLIFNDLKKLLNNHFSNEFNEIRIVNIMEVKK